MTLYEHMPDAIRKAVDEIVQVLRPQPWPDRFAMLYGLLCDKIEERMDSEAGQLLQEWSGIVTAVLEQLPPDSSVAECLALMSISFNDRWRAQAIARMVEACACVPAEGDTVATIGENRDRDPLVFDELCSIYPDWTAIVDDLVEADRKRPLKKSS